MTQPEESPVKNAASIIRSINRRTSLTLKMSLVTIAAGVLIWFMFDMVQTRRLGNLFQDHLNRNLERQATQDRISFDMYVKAHLHSTKLFVSQKRFSDYIERQQWMKDSDVTVKKHQRPPAWFPQMSILRTFARPRIVMLLDSQGGLRELYHDKNDHLPLSLHKPSQSIIFKSRGQNFIAELDKATYLITSEGYVDSSGKERAVLMLASPIDDVFLSAATGDLSEGHVTALLSSEKNPRIISSSNPNIVPGGLALKEVAENYMVTGQEFFDYGSSEHNVRLVSLIALDNVRGLISTITSSDRRLRIIGLPVLIGTFVLLMFWVTRRIQLLTRRIEDFSLRALGTKQEDFQKGDQLYSLEGRFNLLTEEVLEARDVMKREAEERLILEKKNMQMAQKEKQLSLLQSVTQAVCVGVIRKTPHGLKAINHQMEQFAKECGGLSIFDIGDANEQERSLKDKNADNRIFNISCPDVFREDMIYLVSDITKIREQTAALEHLAMHDSLTGLPNRALLQDRLQQAIFIGQRDNQQVALLMMDLDRFKDINDTLGHHIGDLMLKEVGARLPSVLRKSDTIARLGGDEFAIVLPATESEEAKQTTRKLLEILEEPFVIEGHNLYVGASIGITCFPDHGKDASTLLKHADVAMYVAKSTQSGLSFYSPDHDQHSLENLLLMSDLRQAIENGELILHYQPKICCTSRRFIGVEALVRWNHPEHGFIPPDQFIHIAEHTGLIKPLTMWVINTGLKQCNEWKNSIDALNIKMSVNLSVRNLQDLQFPEEVNELLRKWEIEHGYLELEITESAIMEDPDQAMEILTLLHKLGVQLSIDDFGTGYTSLGYLNKLPVNIIKIDESFVINMIMNDSDAMIVRSTIDLAHNLGLIVIAEGVESEEILISLNKLGCDSAQGYHICHPVPAEDFIDWIQNSEWGAFNNNQVKQF